MNYQWTFDGLTTLSLFILCLIYTIGIVNLWWRAGIGRGVKKWQAICFYLAMISLVIALMSPLEKLAEILFTAHMVQHLIMLLLIPILLVLSNQTLALMWGLPPNWRRIIGDILRVSYVKHFWQTLTHPILLWILHTVILWLWHLPTLYELAIQATWIHILEHLTFLGIATLYWWSLLYPDHGSNYGVSILSLFATVIQGALLGALLTFSQTPWYAIYTETSLWGLSALQDQQLAGVIMWIPSGIVYVSAAGTLLVMWLNREEQNQSRNRRIHSNDNK